MTHSQDPTFPLFPILAFLGFLVSLIPLPWHFQAWNAGTCAYMIWTALACLIEFVNALVWSGSIDNVAPVWCDISSKLLLGAGIGIPASTLCISRRLYNIAAVQTVSVTREDKRRAVISDLCIAVGIPVIIMTLHYVVQPHRFDILEDVGCYAAIYNTLPAYFLYFMWPIVLGCISFVYSAMTLRCFWIRRAQFSQFLSSNSSMNASRYLRLMLLALIDMMATLPLGAYSLYSSQHGIPLAPWISWSDTHFNFSRVSQVPALVWRSNPTLVTAVELTRWLYVFAALVFFGLFGFANEAQKHYQMVFWWVAKWVGITPSTLKKGSPFSSSKGWQRAPKSTASLPVYVAQSSTKNAASASFASTLPGSARDFELNTYAVHDLEKAFPAPSPSSAGPPEYAFASAVPDAQPQHHLRSPSSQATLGEPRDRIYITDAPAERTRSPSPAPFSDIALSPMPMERHPFPPPGVRPPGRRVPESEFPEDIDAQH